MSPAKVATFLLDWLPRKVLLLSAEQHAMPHVLAAWVRWAGRRQGLAAEMIAETLDAVFDSMGTFTQVYRDPTAFGLDTALVSRLLPDDDLEALPRRTFAFPVLRGMFGSGVNLAGLDPAAEADRRTLLAADHNDANGRPRTAARCTSTGIWRWRTGCGGVIRPSSGRPRSGCWTGARTGTRCCTR